MAKKVFDGEDLAALQRVLDSGNLSWLTGTASKEFEAEAARRFGCKHAVAVHSAMAGLQLSLSAAGVGEGDEVICDSIVPFAAYAALYLHARPVFADVDSTTFNIDPESIRSRITPRTKAIIVTHLLGLVAPMQEIMRIAEEYGLPVVEDCAHALFGKRSGQLAGTFGMAGVFSFQQSKSLTTGDGGMIVTDDDYIASQIRRMLSFGALAPRLSWNFRMNELTAAVAGVQLTRADGYIEQDRRAAQLYTEVAAAHRGLQAQRTDADCFHSHYMWGAIYEGDRELGVSQEAFQQICEEEHVPGGFGYIEHPPYLHPQFSLTNAFGYDVWRGEGSPYRRGYCPVAERIMPRLLLITISTGTNEDHEQGAAALDRALARLERGDGAVEVDQHADLVHTR